MPEPSDEDGESGGIDMTSEADQSFMDAEADPDMGSPSKEEIYEARLERFRENGWDTSVLTPPEGYSEDDEGSDSSEDSEPTEKADSTSYEDVDDALFEAIEKSSWWETGEYRSGTALSKSPRIWTTDDQVPERVQELIEEVINSQSWGWGDFESLSINEARRLEEMLEEKLTQPQGWSIESLARDIEDEFDLEEEAAVGIASDTSHSVLNEARETAYEEMEGSEEFEYKWLNPQDWRTTPVCNEIIAEVEDRGGSVTLPTLKQIVKQKAQKYEGTHEGGGTPSRADQWKPHYRCRSTFARDV